MHLTINTRTGSAAWLLRGRSLLDIFNPSDQIGDIAHQIIKLLGNICALVIKKPLKLILGNTLVEV